MLPLTILHLDACPYCRNARRAMEELRQESEDFAKVELRWIEENREAAQAAAYADYWYVPSVYLGMQKLYEAQPGDDFLTIKQQLRAALVRAAQSEA